MSARLNKKLLFSTILLITSLFLLAVGLILVAIVFSLPRLPSLERITNYHPSMPMKIYSQDYILIGEYGSEKRTFTNIEDFPDILKYAVLAAEDKKFYKHKGIDILGIIRATIINFIAGGVEQGASTITQQVAKNFFLTNARTYQRKFYEVLLALKIESVLPKDKILELYFNQIYLGQNAYGFAAAAETYFGKPVKELTIAESAMLAGLPKAPAAFNPIINPERARQRQIYVLNNMLSMGWISRERYTEAVNEKLVYKKNPREKVNEDSLYVAELVRKQLHDKYGDAIYGSGYRVITTVTIGNQKAATVALRRTLLRNSPNTKFRGAEVYYEDLKDTPAENLELKALRYLSRHHRVENLVPAIVISASPGQIKVLVESRKDPIILSGNALSFIAKAINNPEMGNKQVAVGSVIRLVKEESGRWRISQSPLLEGALVSLDARTGAILAIVGGFDFFQKQFNRATQAYRQPGSTFKPFIYSAALNKGLTAATVINDAPINFGRYAPKNADGHYAGPITLREALYRSKNVVAVRVLYAIGINYAHNYLKRFGLALNRQPQDLTMVLGSGQVTPLEMARGYTVFANGGYLVEPYIIDRIYDAKNRLIAQTRPLIAGVNAPRTIEPKNAFVMYKLLQDVIQYGTGRAAQAVGRTDIAGKTGTTNNQKDAWFVGFNTRMVTAVFVGFDQPKSMGAMGYGGRIALPIWIDYMRFALRNIPISAPKQPGNVINQDSYYLFEGQDNKEIPVKIDNSTNDPAYDLPADTPDTERKSSTLDTLF